MHQRISIRKKVVNLIFPAEAAALGKPGTDRYQELLGAAGGPATEQARNASAKYGVKSVSLLAAKS
jgi:hypothetical protein